MPRKSRQQTRQPGEPVRFSRRHQNREKKRKLEDALAQEQQEQVPETKPPSFLDLPVHIRIQIYRYAGLQRRCVVRIDIERSKRHFGWDDGCELDVPQRIIQDSWCTIASTNRLCKHPPLPMTLRQVSRAVRDDVSTFFVGRNSFATVLAYKSDFDFFQTSLGWAWGYLKRVHLELRPGDQRYLRVAGGVHGTSWRMWAGFCQLAREKMPHLTAFSLKCKIKIPEVASRLFANVQGFPLLSSCAFHLNTIPNDDVLDMVKRVSWRLTGNIWRGPFPFLRLPKEVQLHVLEYLLTTQSDPYVRRWADAYGNEMQSSQGVITLQNRRHQRVNEDSPLTCCGTCSPMQAMCFCSTRQCSFSTTCTCFTSPLPYFLVSREFHHMTAHMFYARNLFAFVDEDPDAMLRTIVNIPTPTLLHIRLLAFVFPSLFRSSTRPAHRAEDIALLSWAVMRRFIREHFTLDLLTLCVMDFGSRNHFPAGFLNRRRYLRRLLLAFAELPNLRDFWLYLVDDRGFEEEARRVVLGERVLREQTFLRRITVAGHP